MLDYIQYIEKYGQHILSEKLPCRTIHMVGH